MELEEHGLGGRSGGDHRLVGPDLAADADGRSPPAPPGCPPGWPPGWPPPGRPPAAGAPSVPRWPSANAGTRPTRRRRLIAPAGDHEPRVRSSVGLSSSKPSKPRLAVDGAGPGSEPLGELVAGLGGHGDGVDLDDAHRRIVVCRATRRASPEPCPLHSAPPCRRRTSPCWCGSGRKYKRCHKTSEGRVLPGVDQPDARRAGHRSPARYADTGEPSGADEPRVKSPEIIERMRHAGGSRPRSCASPASWSPRRHHRRDRRRRARAVHRAGRATRARSTTTATRSRCAPRSTRSSATASPTTARCRTATSSTSTSPSTSTACTATPTPRSSSATSTPKPRGSSRSPRSASWHGIEAVRPGRPLSDIGRAIEDHAKQHRYGVVRAFVGHGIGEQFHTDLQVLHYYEPRAHARSWSPGMTSPSSR